MRGAYPLYTYAISVSSFWWEGLLGAGGVARGCNGSAGARGAEIWGLSGGEGSAGLRGGVGRCGGV